nr:hypothetical protein [Chromobacterium sp. ASV5]
MSHGFFLLTGWGGGGCCRVVLNAAIANGSEQEEIAWCRYAL